MKSGGLTQAETNTPIRLCIDRYSLTHVRNTTSQLNQPRVCKRRS